jgi:hypothetical protein
MLHYNSTPPPPFSILLTKSARSGFNIYTNKAVSVFMKCLKKDAKISLGAVKIWGLENMWRLWP